MVKVPSVDVDGFTQAVTSVGVAGRVGYVSSGVKLPVAGGPCRVLGMIVVFCPAQLPPNQYVPVASELTQPDARFAAVGTAPKGPVTRVVETPFKTLVVVDAVEQLLVNPLSEQEPPPDK
jgi:hypothetical protein